MSRLMSLVAALLGLATSTGLPRVKQPTLSVEVDGLDALEHRPLLVMGAGGPFSRPCEDVHEASQLAFTRGRFALYDDGLVIFTRTTAASCAEVEAHVGPGRAKALVDSIFDAGFADVAPVSEANCSDAPGVFIEARRGATWHRAAVEGLDRFGTHTCRSYDPTDPTFIVVLRALTFFDAADAVPWVPREVAIGLWPSEPYPPDLVRRAVPWPAGLPPPKIVPGARRVVQYYDSSVLAAAQSAISPLGNSFVVLDGKTWAYGCEQDVLPEHEYLERVTASLRRRSEEMGTFFR